MRRVERIRDLTSDFRQFRNRESTAIDPPVQRLSLNKLHRQEMDAMVLANFVNVSDVGVIQCGCRPGFPAEPFHPHGVMSNGRGKHLERHSAVEPVVGGQVHLSHTTLTKARDDAVVSYAVTRD
jgi:hypothetical protein